MSSSTTLYLVRHAKAGERSKWTEDDRLRPLSKRGRRQAERLVGLFEGRSVERVLSSPYDRCAQTVRPLALAREVPIETDEALAEGAELSVTLSLLQASSDGSVFCSHGDVIPAVIEHLSRQGMTIDGELACRKGSLWVLERTEGRFSRAQYEPPPEGG